MSKPLNFQSLILALQHFWADQGCLVWQPYYSQVGAGTMNPATALRVLGPEPWNVAYVEPSVRPDDGRYGDNPNRMQMHYQFQVILKPDPGNPQELYLQSLAALGIDPRQHDIRFVEDNWESPALGAWGLGWEVWLDGQEITQFTYFQQAGGRPCDPVAVEITYGLDRIAIGLQRVRGFTEIDWNGTLTAGDVNFMGEREHSQYYFDVADVERLRQMYDLYLQEANACLEKNLVLPAHDYVLKMSHNFNVLDSRGAIGVTERQAFFAGMRDLSRRVADAYIEQRQRLEYPWLKESSGSAQAAPVAAAAAAPAVLFPAPQDFLLEIGTEELPVSDLETLQEQLAQRLPGLLSDLRLEHGALHVYATPRRLVAHVETVAPRQPDIEQVVKGPPADRAYDSFGQPNKAAEGFARSKGVSLSDLQVREMDGGRYLAAVVFQSGRPAQSVLADALPEFIATLKVDKAMRWNATNVLFSRPIRWLLALFGGQVVPFSYAGLRSGSTTRGLRFVAPEEILVNSPADYFQALTAQGIDLEVSRRQQRIQEQVTALAEKVSGEVDPIPSLLAEVANLVEAPWAVLGSFDPVHLKLPHEVLVSVMKKHQRYFPVEKGGQLLPYFITVSNKGIQDRSELDLVVEGNEHVVRARFADADFFVREDLKHTLADFLPRLRTLTFHVKLGSMYDKSQRVKRMVPALAASLGLSPEETSAAVRAAELCKADLATHMVVEMTSLQGIMGRHYAHLAGESQEVAQAIFDHYLPRFAGDSLPQGRPGIVVGIGDRLDTLAGLFAAGMVPSGTKDPYAQRRAALGLVQVLISASLDFDLRLAIQQVVVPTLPLSASPESQAACLQFIIERLRNLLLEQGARFDVVDAILAAQGHNPSRAAQAVKALASWTVRSDWNTILPAYSRCVRITRELPDQYPVDPTVFVESAETALYTALQAAEKASPRPGSVDDFFASFMPLIPTINQYFEAVLVMDADHKLRQNRLGLLQRIAALANGVADLSKLEGF